MSKNQNTFVDTNAELNLINPVMRPEDIRIGDPIKCEIFTGEKTLLVKLWSYCPFGFEIVVPESVELALGSIKTFMLQFGKTILKTKGSIVFHRNHPNGNILAGVRIHYEPLTADLLNKERRSKNRWNCPEHLLPSGTTPNPIRFNDFILFRVVDVSANGLRLATSLRNKMLCVGQILEATISVPMIGPINISLKIHRVALDEVYGKQQLILGVTFVRTDEVMLSTLSEYLLTFAEKCTVLSLKESGFPARYSNTAYDFTYVKSQKDYEDVLQLRYDCYIKSGKLGEGITPDFMRDEFDSRARILIVKHQGKIIASVRGMFHEKGDKTSHERYLVYPPQFPDPSECLELSRLCVHEEHQSAGLANELTKHFILLAIKSARKHCYFSVTDSFKPHWLKLGFIETNVNYVHEQLGNARHHLMICNAERAILGRITGPSAWLSSYEHLFDYCVEYGLIEPSVFDLIKSNWFRAIRIFVK